MTVAQSFSSASRGQSAGSFVSFCELFLSFLSVRYDDRASWWSRRRSGVLTQLLAVGGRPLGPLARFILPNDISQVYDTKYCRTTELA